MGATHPLWRCVIFNWIYIVTSGGVQCFIVQRVEIKYVKSFFKSVHEKIGFKYFCTIWGDNQSILSPNLFIFLKLMVNADWLELTCEMNKQDSIWCLSMQISQGFNLSEIDNQIFYYHKLVSKLSIILRLGWSSGQCKVSFNNPNNLISDLMY